MDKAAYIYCLFLMDRREFCTVRDFMSNFFTWYYATTTQVETAGKRCPARKARRVLVGAVPVAEPMPLQGPRVQFGAGL